MSVYTTVFAGSTPIGNGLTGGVGGLWGTPVAIAMNGAVTLGAEAIAAIAVLRGRIGQDRPSAVAPIPAPQGTGGAPSVE
jgi:hypothetical protein